MVFPVSCMAKIAKHSLAGGQDQDEVALVHEAYEMYSLHAPRSKGKALRQALEELAKSYPILFNTGTCNPWIAVT